ncbi:MAG: dihydropyrimidinase [Anaerolineae bacterium]|nr:dihydropyrimidinase [Anaerolineae bacterium]
MTHARRLLIRGGTIVTHEATFEGDVLIEGETIQAIGKNLTAALAYDTLDARGPISPAGDSPALGKAASGSQDLDVIDAGGLLVLPGIIDAHAHIELDTGIYKTPDSWFVESRAAAFGGVTTVIDFATQFKGQTLEEAVAARRRETAPSVIDYAYHVMATDLAPGQEDDLGILGELGATSVKLYTTYRPNYYADDATLLRLLEAAGQYGLMTLVHCENDALVTAQTQALITAGHTGWRHHGAARPVLAEQEAANRVLFLAREVAAPVVIAHNSSARTSMLVAVAREAGQVAFCETAPQYLLLDNTVYEGNEPWRYILQPPLRAPEERELLWDAVSRGYVDMFITDHCAYTRDQKIARDDFTKTPGGLPGLETLFPLMATYGVAAGRLDWPDLVRMLATNPAQIYGLWPRKGALLPGSDADLVLYDPGGEQTLAAESLHSGAGYSPYEGMPVVGRVAATLRRGELLVRDGAFLGTEGSGTYLKREPVFWE